MRGANTQAAAGAPRAAGMAAFSGAAQLPQCAFDKCINTAAEIQCSAPAEREQETYLSVNGISIRDAGNPAGRLPEISLAAHREELWRLVNAAADTYIRLQLADIDGSGVVRNVPIEVVGLDGVPFADKTGRPNAQMSTGPIMVPSGGRIEFKVKLDAPAAQHVIVLRTEAVETGCAGDLMPGRDLLLMRFHQNISGEFVFHCHILSHEDKGMMGLIRVIYPGGQRSPSLERLPEHHH
jgi:FtsP/CotA-like multicopper oxidase with cupredoxin domain